MKNRFEISDQRGKKKSYFYWSRRAFLFSAFVCLVLLLLTAMIFGLWQQRDISLAKEHAQSELQNLRRNLYLLLGNQQMFASMIAQQIEERLVTEPTVFLSSLDSQFSFLLNHHPSFVTTTIAKGNVVVDQFPQSDLHGVGFHLTDIPQFHEHIACLSSHQGVILDGPLYLEDGKACMVSRVSIFDASGECWGLLTLHYDLQGFLLEAGILELSHMYRYYLEFRHLGGDEVFFWGYDEIMDLDPVVLPVSFSLLSWNIFIAPQTRWTSDSLPLIIYAIFGVLLSISFGLHAYFRQINFQLLKVRSHTDSLTGLLNKREFLTRVHQMLASRKPFALALIDIDNFKVLNDTYGHVDGDKALLALVERMRFSIRAYDLIGRFGGDEFIILLPECTQSQTLLRLYKSINNNTTLVLDGKKVSISLSMGVVFYPAEGSNAEELLQIADRRLYSAKLQGKGRVCLQG